MLFLTPNQQCQSIDGKWIHYKHNTKLQVRLCQTTNVSKRLHYIFVLNHKHKATDHLYSTHTLHSHPEITKATCEIRQTSYNRNQTQSTSTATAVSRPLYRSISISRHQQFCWILLPTCPWSWQLHTHTHIRLTVLFP